VFLGDRPPAQPGRLFRPGTVRRHHTDGTNGRNPLLPSGFTPVSAA
jgi:hypothetical protein